VPDASARDSGSEVGGVPTVKSYNRGVYLVRHSEGWIYLLAPPLIKPSSAIEIRGLSGPFSTGVPGQKFSKIFGVWAMGPVSSNC
jgi:hypothetical protein